MSEKDQSSSAQELIRRFSEAGKEPLLKAVFSSIPEAMIIIDVSGTILLFNRTAEEMFGYSTDDVIGKNVSVLMTDADNVHHDRYLSSYLNTGKAQIIGIGRVVQARRADASTMPVHLTVSEMALDGHRLFTGYIRDVTKEQAAHLKISEMQVELANFSRLSTVGTMASAMAHELNQPLTAIANYLEAARDIIEGPPETAYPLVQEALDAAAKQSIRAGQIVRRLRDFVSRGEFELSSVQIDSLIREAISLSKVESKGVKPRVVVECEPDLPDVMIDPLQIRQVLINLIRNAVEALEDESAPLITVSASMEGSDVRVDVRDNGHGLPADVMKTLFEPFHSSKSHGMGLGLSICQTIVETHGGKIKAEHCEEGGARFSFTLKT